MGRSGNFGLTLFSAAEVGRKIKSLPSLPQQDTQPWCGAFPPQCCGGKQGWEVPAWAGRQMGTTLPGRLLVSALLCPAEEASGEDAESVLHPSCSKSYIGS